ncbi:MAG: hypothetical protein LLG14_27245 [Nocardiaceae bacterium]|nr:hypothetical protein [Nocardiaceae bacterium]
MALNTRTRRKAVMGMGMSFLLHLNAPSGSNLDTEGERKLFLGLSSAIASGLPPVAGPGAIYLLMRGVG